ncbi:MAG: hypothetical protein KDC48_22330, partial [Planctomycetes bacterium]|nr:hypothetical protein [Planctomycetota bacterium]
GDRGRALARDAAPPVSAARAGTAIVAILLGAGLKAQDFIDLPWRLTADGRVEVQVGAAPTGDTEPSTGEWLPMFPGLLPREPDGGDGFGETGTLGVIALVPLLFHGPGGAAAIDDASRRLQKLGIRVSMLPASVSTTTPDPLLDLLRVRHIARGQTDLSDFALGAFLADEHRGEFVHAAAAQALLDRNGIGAKLHADAITAALQGRDGTVALQAAVERVPDIADLILVLHTAALPPATAALAAWRRAMQNEVGRTAREMGGSMSPAIIVRPQRAMDQPGQLPFELAVRFGNWRVDGAVIALRRGDVDAWWFRLGGRFDPTKLATGLAATAAQAMVREKDGVVTAQAHGWSLRASRDFFEAWQGDFGAGPFGSRAAELRSHVAAGQPPAWIFVPRSSALWRNAGWEPADLHVDLDPQLRSVSATANCQDAEIAKRLLRRWKALQVDLTIDLDDPVSADQPWTWRQVRDAGEGLAEDLKPILRLREWIGAVTSGIEANTIRGSASVAELPIFDVLHWLRYVKH